MSDHEWESRVSRELGQRAQGLDETPFSLDQVKGRAGSIRRTRRLAVAGAVLASAAVVVPIAVVSGQGLGDTDSAPGPATSPTTSPTTSSATPTRATDGVTPAPAPTADAIGVDYLDGSTWVRPDGTAVPLDIAYRGGAVLGETLLGVRDNTDTNRHFIDVVSPDGAVGESIEITSGLAVSDDRSVVAFVEPNGDLMTMWDPAAGEGGRVAIASGLTVGTFTVDPIAVVGGPTCGPEDECRVFYNAGDGVSPPRVASSDGTDVLVVPGDVPAVAVSDASDAGLVTVQQTSQDQGSCNGLYDITSAAYLWTTCDRFLLDLNPAGSVVATTHAYLDGPGNGYVALVDAASQEEVARFDPSDGVVVTQTWLDDETLLALVLDGRGSSIWRFGTDGSSERVTSRSTGGGYDTSPTHVLLVGY
ncbi:hypothetical protein NPS01_02770 [Nocardioides psychrotolerans]|uniref:WD40-like Beta Propeller Repeat n=1 Tax=Nocardioides psychrotolerans TaxID=1005945 RepID=A0A1I3BKB1_9ACTN|nr:hypothetical protein [Nocardioides psychrotolerans]GEP36614.1 hypothetical protein NPS01_02770 [Nocardioides psychrotolerans]SFH62181.1 hypothetical protein SAMN05216561_101162 [Nocardioides psychrotolerans]